MQGALCLCALTAWASRNQGMVLRASPASCFAWGSCDQEILNACYAGPCFALLTWLVRGGLNVCIPGIHTRLLLLWCEHAGGGIRQR